MDALTLRITKPSGKAAGHTLAIFPWSNGQPAAKALTQIKLPDLTTLPIEKMRRAIEPQQVPDQPLDQYGAMLFKHLHSGKVGENWDKDERDSLPPVSV